LSGVVGTLTALFDSRPELLSLLPVLDLDIEQVHTTAMSAWLKLPKANPNKFNACILRERKALLLEK